LLDCYVILTTSIEADNDTETIQLDFDHSKSPVVAVWLTI